MVRKLLHMDMVPPMNEERTTAQRQAAVRAAYITAEAMEDSFRGSDLQFGGNVADALYHIATALQRIADAIEGRKP